VQTGLFEAMFKGDGATGIAVGVGAVLLAPCRLSAELAAKE
jgi:hypothetical protein